MSRRKQRNPKSLCNAPLEEEEEEERVKKEPVEAEEEEEEPCRDVSNLVKVELDDDLLNSSAESLDPPHHPRHAAGVPSVDDVMRKWNMFQFGEVVVPNHPILPVVPMALQMVYLYPLGRGEGGEVRYKMLVPMNGVGGAAPPLFPAPHSPPLLHLNQFLGEAAPPAPAKRSDDDIKQSPPLDLTNKSPEHPGSSNNDDISKKPTPFGLESQLSLLKMKELELLKAPSAPPVNRCVECNINFSKYQNYLAHKKYYCSGVKQQQQLGGEQEEEVETKHSVKPVSSQQLAVLAPPN